MKSNFKILLIVIFMVFFFSVCLANAAPVGKITRLEGRVDVLKPGQGTVSSVSLGDGVDVGDIYRAKTNSRAEITFFNNNILRIAPATRVQVSQYSDDGTRSNQIMKLDRGKVEAVSGKEFIKKVSSYAEGNKFEVHTPNAVAGIRGSGMTVGFAQMITGLFFSTGRGYFYNPSQPGQIVNVTAGFVSFVVGTGGLPSRPAPGNASYVGGGAGGTSPTVQSTSTTGSDLIQTNLINPINQTYTFTPPPAITSVLVGSVPYLSGGFGSPTGEFGFMASLNNVKFYGPSATAQPQTWLADSVTGSFYNFDGGNRSFTFKVCNGSTISAYATVTGSDTDYTGTWSASISNGNATQGVGGYTQPFTFSGTASGTWSANYSGTGTLTGNASGVVPSTLTSEPIVTTAVQVGTTFSMSNTPIGPYYDSMTVSGIKFWGSTVSSAPYSWTASSIAGTRDVASPVTTYSFSSASGVTATVGINPAANGTWTGNVYNGNVPATKLGPSPAYQGAVGFNGRASGTYTTSGSSQIITGTASGKAGPQAAY